MVETLGGTETSRSHANDEDINVAGDPNSLAAARNPTRKRLETREWRRRGAAVAREAELTCRQAL